jgi:hypothetical protein
MERVVAGIARVSFAEANVFGESRIEALWMDVIL